MTSAVIDFFGLRARKKSIFLLLRHFGAEVEKRWRSGLSKRSDGGAMPVRFREARFDFVKEPLNEGGFC
ncbi:hypothetical protein JOC55_002303 [Paenibacillus sacheonensis]|nr:hypothetical protein [Paenibacillus sacheonensis]